MKSPVLTLKLRDSVMHARDLLEEHRVNQLLVLCVGELMGNVTDRDVRDASPSLAQSGAAGRGVSRLPPNIDPARIPVEDVMTPAVLTVAPDTSVIEAAKLMRSERVGSVPVLEEGRVIGILTRSDLLDALISACAPSAAVL